MADFLVSTVLAFVGVVALIAAIAVALASLFVLIIARKGDRPVELSPRGAAVSAISLCCLVAWQALDILAGLPL